MNEHHAALDRPDGQPSPAPIAAPSPVDPVGAAFADPARGGTRARRHPPSPAVAGARESRRWLEIAVGILLAVTFATGGGAQDHGAGDVLAQLLALPVLVAALVVLAGERQAPLGYAAIGLGLSIAALPALQLLPIPEWLWRLPPARAALLHDLDTVGVVARHVWTLTPAATERAAWSQLPALAAFCSALALGPRSRRRLATWVLALVTAGLLLGVLQMIAGQDSVLNPFPEWVPVIGGVFANPNHQAVALVIGATLGTATWLDARRRAPARGSVARLQWAGALAAAACVIALPVTGSRAGMLLVVPAIVALLWASRAIPSRLQGPPRHRRALVQGALLLMLIPMGLALYLLRQTMTTEARWPMATATARLAREAWPLGTGVGSFRSWFEQAGPDALLSLEFINHAHNEYVQWWLEGGLAAVLLLAGALALIAAVARCLVRDRAGPVAQAAWIGVVVLLAASIVDYPLRTAALMTVGAYLAGSAVARASRPSQHARRR